ncbi:MAG: NAD-dependent epimerase/dehydratase family protein [Bacilli bacterium]
MTGIIHLAASGAGLRDRSAEGLFENLRVNHAGFLNVLQAAHAWGVTRMCMASTIGIYGGVSAPFREDILLPTD